MKLFVGLTLLLLVHVACGEEEVCEELETGFKICGTDEKIHKVTKTGKDKALEINIEGNVTIAANTFKDVDIEILLLTGTNENADKKDLPILSLDKDAFQGLANLEFLLIKFLRVRCDGNPLAPLEQLTILQLRDGDLDAIPTEILASLPNLEAVIIEQNSIITLTANSFANVKKLEQLDLSKNWMTSIEQGAFNGLDSLESLDLSFNRFEAIPTAISGLKNLRRLELDYNINLKTIDSEALKDLPELGELHLTFSDISELKPGCFDNVRKLTSLRLDGNEITTIPKGVFNKLRRLEDLTLSTNDIETIEEGALDGLNLDTLDLARNKLTTIPTGLFNTGEIKVISLASCLINEIKPKAFDGLRATRLDLSDNKLTKIGTEEFHGVKADNLDLTDNKIDEVATDAFKNAEIEKVELSGNPVKDKTS